MSGFGTSGFGGAHHLGDALSALLDGELPAGQEAMAQAHLAGCPVCARELRAVSQARTCVRALPLVEPPFGFYERMLRDARRPAPEVGYYVRPSLRRRAGLAALGAAAAAVTVLAGGSPSPRPLNPAPPQLVQAHAASSSVGADLLTKLAPVGIPFSGGR